ncbi:MAG: diaminopimelate epimerase [Vicingaceae bacterium]
MEINFSKYQGTGNDFVLIDGTKETVKFSASEIQTICERRFGIGADGLIIIRNHADSDFEMDYYNADGSQSFCGNGSRCAQAYAKTLGLIEDQSTFLAIDGIHKGRSVGDDFATQMGEVKEVQQLGDDYFVQTGSPHYIRYVEDVDAVDVYNEGRQIRYSDAYRDKGTNVNFVSEQDGFLRVRTYERGVEGETFSCGTGVTAVAISFLYKNRLDSKQVKILTRGGELRIALNKVSDREYNDIWLVGPAVEVFKGRFELRK